MPVFKLLTEELVPLIVTPGLNKYEKTHSDPFRTIINGADDALKNASAFLCIGFGFRDQHIQPKIIERCKEQNVPIIVLAKSLTEEAKKFLMKNIENNYMGIEEFGDQSKVYSSDNPNGVEIAKADLWTLCGFNSLVS